METKYRIRVLSDVDSYVTIELLDPIFNTLPVFIRRWEIQTYAGVSVRKVAYTRFGETWFVIIHGNFKTLIL
jgi:hypothetical protein